jgi:hypothetical protein
MEITNKLLEIGKWGIVLIIVLEITALVSGSIFMKEKVFDRKDQQLSSHVLYFDELQKLKGKH